MTIKELYKEGYDIHRKNRANNWVIAVVFVLFACAIISLGYVISGLSIILVPFVLIPLYFAFALFHFVQTNKANLTFKHVFKFYSLYYSPRFFGVFRIIISFLISLLVEICITLIAGLIIFYVFKKNFDPDFTQSITNLANNLQYASTAEEMNELLNGINGVLSLYSFWVSATTSFFAVAAFLYFVLKNSLGIYYRATVSPSNRPLQKRVIKELFRQRRWKMFKLYFLGVFGPLFLLMLIGYGTAFAVCYINMENLNYIQTTCYVASLGMIVFFLPFAMTNMEVIADHFQKDYITIFEGAVKSFLEQYAQYTNIVENPQQESPQDEEPQEEKKDDDIIDNDIDFE